MYTIIIVFCLYLTIKKHCTTFKDKSRAGDLGRAVPAYVRGNQVFQYLEYRILKLYT